MHHTQILLKPVVSEKANAAKEGANNVLFLVHPKANKIEVKGAVEQAFKVKVEAVNIVRRRVSARRRFGKVLGKEPGYKKAYVKLAAGDKIEFFEGV
jgi:large subunit ribosomal protein L23